jgi:3-deoxy-D-manno-octulosonate 8-phosphate phosphatase (KDO 8-P phosphatase)
MTADKIKEIKLLLLDVDGVLTNGSIVYSDEGMEIKAFNVKDGLGIRLLKEAGIDVGIVTGRRSNALRHRCGDLGIQLIYEGVKDKSALLEDIHRKTGIHPRAMAFMGDDLPDIPIMKMVGVSIAVADAAADVIAQADLVTKSPGGAGAVREACETILMARGCWQEITARFNQNPING